MTNRRDFMRYSGVAAMAVSLPSWAQDEVQLPTRPIAGTDEELAVIGLGNSSAFRSADRAMAEPLLDIFLSRGGNYIDVGGPSSAFVGQLGQEMGRTDQLFLANYVDPTEVARMREHVVAMAKAQGKSALDLVHTRNLAGFRQGHDAYRQLREDGLVRFIGVARTGAGSHGMMAGLIEDGLVDFIQVNYSMMEPQAGDRLLPLAADNGVGVAISRPFINGDYFSMVRGHELPDWAAEFDCESWAQFSLKFILANPAVNCVLTETANPKHAVDNIGAGFGRLPDAAMRQRMLEHLRGLQ
jgi:aryl-alcohol dehydrogenase-like predicted oxidoreductase